MTQLELFTAPKPPTEKQRQLKRLLSFLKSGGHVDPTTSYQKVGILAISQRVGNLKEMGWDVKSCKLKTAGGAVVSEYYLDNCGVNI